MPGNSQRKGAVRKRGKGNTAGSGGRVRRGLEGKGPTPKAEDRPYHKAYRTKQSAARQGGGTGSRGSHDRPRTGRPGSGPEWVAGQAAKRSHASWSPPRASRTAVTTAACAVAW